MERMMETISDLTVFHNNGMATKGLLPSFIRNQKTLIIRKGEIKIITTIVPQVS